jgi:hypothetical protein
MGPTRPNQPSRTSNSSALRSQATRPKAAMPASVSSVYATSRLAITEGVEPSGKTSSHQIPANSRTTAGQRPNEAGYANGGSRPRVPKPRAAPSSRSNNVRKGLRLDQGLPSRTATIGRPTQMPIQNSTAGSGDMGSTRKPLKMAPIHQASPTSLSRTDATRSSAGVSGRTG